MNSPASPTLSKARILVAEDEVATLYAISFNFHSHTDLYE